MKETLKNLMEELKTASGGTELVYRELYKRLPEELLEKFQIYSSRITSTLKNDKVRLLWIQDLPGDPASEHLKNGGWKKFHKIIFVSNWQSQAFINYYQIPPSHTMVIQNAINPIPEHTKPNDGVIRLGYWSTPHRGLEILVPVFKKLCDKYDNIELHVMSSFSLYGWSERDEPYKQLFEECKNTNKIHYYGALPNDEVREVIKDLNIHAYPNIWQETSCCVLQEAMSAKLLCVHPNLGALPETAANFTNMYQFHEQPNYHAGIFYNALEATIDIIKNKNIDLENRLNLQKGYTDLFYSWTKREVEWQQFLLQMKDLPTELPEETFFEYKVR